MTVPTDLVLEAELLRQLVVHRRDEAKRVIDSGVRPSASTPSWEAQNWQAEDDFWKSYFYLIDRLEKKNTGLPLMAMVRVKYKSFEIEVPEGHGLFVELALRVFAAFPLKKWCRVVGRPLEFSAEWVAWEPYTSSPGYYDDPADFPGNTHTLVSRWQYFFLAAVVRILPRSGVVMVTRDQLQRLGVGSEEIARLCEVRIMRLQI